jgi:hypothetical protein
MHDAASKSPPTHPKNVQPDPLRSQGGQRAVSTGFEELPRRLGVGSPRRSAPRQGAGIQLADTDDVARKLRTISVASVQDLKGRWQALTGSSPPSCLSRDLLMRAVADQLQEAALGGLPPDAKRRLGSLVRAVQAGQATGTSAAAGLRLKPGTRLVRTWRGQTHTVQVLESGFEHQGRRYSSLSQIAGAITGTNWSGPRFFGLAQRRRSPGTDATGHGA